MSEKRDRAQEAALLRAKMIAVEEGLDYLKKVQPAETAKEKAIAREAKQKGTRNREMWS
jgi:hypothetical protein